MDFILDKQNTQEEKQINQHKQVSFEDAAEKEEMMTFRKTKKPSLDESKKKKKNNKSKKEEEPIIIQSPEPQIKEENSDQSLLSKNFTKSVNINSDKDEILSNESLEETKRGLLKNANQSGKPNTRTKNIQDDGNKN